MEQRNLDLESIEETVSNTVQWCLYLEKVHACFDLINGEIRRLGARGALPDNSLAPAVPDLVDEAASLSRKLEHSLTLLYQLSVPRPEIQA